jgi:hypothetical protein
MNRNQFTLLIFLLVVLGIAGLMIYNKQNDVAKSGDPAIGRKLLGDLPVNDVAHISLKQGTNELNLVKKDNLWRVHERNDYPANYSEISEFLLKARDLKIVQTEHVGPSQLPRLELVPGQGTNAALVVDLKDQKDKTIQSLILGKKHMQKSNQPSPFGDMGGDAGFPDGRYVKVSANSDTVALISDALSNIEPKPEQWLNKDFFRVEKVRSIAVAGPALTNSWKIVRDTENAEWKLADAKPGEQLDTSKSSSAANALGTPSFTDVKTDSKPDQTGLDKPTTVTLDTFEDFAYTVNVGSKTNDAYPMTVAISAKIPSERTPGKDEKPDEKTRLDKEFKEKQKKLEDKLAQEKACEKWVYLVSSWTLEPLLKDRAQLLVEKKEEPKKDESKKDDKGVPSAQAPTIPAPLPQPTATDPPQN